MVGNLSVFQYLIEERINRVVVRDTPSQPTLFQYIQQGNRPALFGNFNAGKIQWGSTVGWRVRTQRSNGIAEDEWTTDLISEEMNIEGWDSYYEQQCSSTSTD